MKFEIQFCWVHALRRWILGKQESVTPDYVALHASGFTLRTKSKQVIFSYGCSTLKTWRLENTGFTMVPSTKGLARALLIFVPLLLIIICNPEYLLIVILQPIIRGKKRNSSFLKSRDTRKSKEWNNERYSCESIGLSSTNQEIKRVPNVFEKVILLHPLG